MSDYLGLIIKFTGAVIVGVLMKTQFIDPEFAIMAVSLLNVVPSNLGHRVQQ